MSEEITQVVRKSPRELWDSESSDFTPWLAEHIEYLNDELGTSFSVLEREKATPTGFSIDLVVEDEDERTKGIIEAQLTESDHKHLGQVLTYATAFEAEVAVWIVREPRYEHKKTIEWLNESTEKSFYLVSIEAIEVAGTVAPLFTSVSEPSPAAKEIGDEKREPSERERELEEFWDGLLAKSDAAFQLFRAISPKRRDWIQKSAGIGGISYNYLIRTDYGGVELYIDTNSREDNKELFDRLFAEKADIEDEFGGELKWRRLDDKRASRIRAEVVNAGLTEKDEWDRIQDEMVDAMQRFYQTFDRRITESS